MLTSFMEIIAGLGLFLYGVHLLGANLRGLATRRVQSLIRNATNNRVRAFSVGLVVGGVSQSLAGITFICVGLLSAGMINLSSALPIIIGGNVGGTLLPLFASLNIRPGVLFVLGVAGYILATEQFPSLRHVTGVLLGAALLFLGLDLVNTGALPFADDPDFASAITTAGSSPLLALVGGTILAVLVQGSVAIAILTMSLYREGLLNYESAIMLTYAVNIGSSLSLALLSVQLRGAARQVAGFSVIFNFLGAIVLLPLFFIEVWGDVPLVLAALKYLVPSPGLQVVTAYIMFNLVAAVVAFIFSGPLGRWLARRYPEDAGAAAGRAMYLDDHVLRNPVLALALVEREQERVLNLIGRLSDVGRNSDPDARVEVAAVERDRINAVLKEINAYMKAIASDPADAEFADRLHTRLENQHQLEDLAFTFGELASFAPRGGPVVDDFRLTVMEAADTARLVLLDALETPDDTELRQMLATLVAERGNSVAGVRERFLADSDGPPAAVRLALLDITTLFERSMWRLRRLKNDMLPGTV
ncbi:Na/Pi symporter [Acuticoccus sp. MNP-M23]|uniref:Na/Pi cotransporter family protein n=1 Tax=Acuticoccus sp. MNP-M23 TaxID=3072793 RepID=UPI002814C6D3|nr:Na/Pi symporter [Acuticoccus sp. MNP-M23]WMS42492.1 Na/Pi symporter [Acuticoccus sp. MNP-M23]